MKELGKDENQYHYDVGKYFAKSECDYLFTLGKLSKNTKKGAVENGLDVLNTRHFDDIDEIVKYLKNFMKKDDTILIKGSHSMEMDKISKMI